MKKHLHYLLAAALFTLGFTACEDVPAPYEINNEGGEESEILLDEDFSTSLGDFNTFCTVGNFPWTVSYSCAQVTSYVDTDGDGVKENVEATSWLVSPRMDLTEVDSAYVSFDYILRYAKADQLKSHYQLLVSADYPGSGRVEEATWDTLTFHLVQGSDWDTWYSSGNVDIPAEFCGQPNVTVALRYISTTKAATWEVKNFLVRKGQGGYTPEGPSHDQLRQLPYTEPFSTELGGFQNYTTSGSGEWIIDYFTAKATGYDNASQQTTAGTYYLVSPPVSLAGQTAAHVAYDYILRYDRGAENQQLLINAAFDPAHPDQGWTLLKQDHEEGTDWETFARANVDIPAQYMGQTVRIAFRYNTNAQSGSTWEVKNFEVAAGAGEATTDPHDELHQLPYTEPFATTLGDYKSYTTSGSGQWIIDYSTAKASGYDNASQTTTAGTYYLVSPPVSLAGQTEAHMAYEYILRYDRGAENQQTLINADFDPARPDQGWELLKQDHEEGRDWTTFASADIAIPAKYMGQTVRFAFRYNSDATSGSTWEVRNASILSGKPGEGGETGGDIGDPDASNGDFENWSGGQPVRWKSSTTATKGAMTMSTDAHGGQYAVEVAGSTSGNNRLAYEEITLPAGTYTMTFYCKAATATGGSVRPGYTPVGADGKVGSYVYGEYTNDLTTGQWVRVTHEFELGEATKLNLVIMVAKNPGGAVLFDDFVLTDASGNELIH